MMIGFDNDRMKNLWPAESDVLHDRAVLQPDMIDCCTAQTCAKSQPNQAAVRIGLNEHRSNGIQAGAADPHTHVSG